MIQKMLMSSGGGGVGATFPDISISTPVQIASGSQSVSLSIPSDGMVWGFLNLSYGSSGYIEITKNGTQLYITTTKGLYNLLIPVVSGDSVVITTNSSSNSYYNFIDAE